MSELRKFDEPIELQRLRKLQILIETDMWFSKNIEFDIGNWKRRKHIKKNFLGLKFSVPDPNCGTTACLCGMYAITHPEDGLSFMEDKEHKGSSHIVYKESLDYEAISEFFGIDLPRVYYLFSPDSYIAKEFSPHRPFFNYLSSKEIKAEALGRLIYIIQERVECPN